MVRGEEDLDPGQDQKDSQQNGDPMDLQQHRAKGDEHHPKKQGAEDAVKENLMLILVGDSEKPEYHHEDEKVVDGKGLFDDETGQKLERRGSGLLFGVESREDGETGVTGKVMLAVEIEGEVEGQRQGDPKNAPTGRLPHPHRVGFPVKDPQIQGQNPQHKHEKSRVEPQILPERE